MPMPENIFQTTINDYWSLSNYLWLRPKLEWVPWSVFTYLVGSSPTCPLMPITGRRSTLRKKIFILMLFHLFCHRDFGYPISHQIYIWWLRTAMILKLECSEVQYNPRGLQQQRSFYYQQSAGGSTRAAYSEYMGFVLGVHGPCTESSEPMYWCR